jgi:hypothetical protein
MMIYKIDPRSFLEGLKLDKEAMVSIDTGDAVRGVIITTKVTKCLLT